MLRSVFGAGTLDYLVRMAPGFLAALLVFVCLCPWRRRRLAARGLESPAPREIAMALFWMFCGGMALVVLTPRDFRLLPALIWPSHYWPAFFSVGSVNLVPFRTFGLESWTLFILLGNLIMFLPFGFFLVLLWRGFAWKRLLPAGFCITLFIECWQLLVGRAFDIDDLLLNTLGVLLGGLLCLVLRRLAPNLARRFRVHLTE